MAKSLLGVSMMGWAGKGRLGSQSSQLPVSSYQGQALDSVLHIQYLI